MTLSVETLARAIAGGLPPSDRAFAKARRVLTAIEQSGYVVVPGWQPIESAPMDEPFLAAIAVSHISGTGWWERHVIYLDDETGDVHADCEQGWSLRDYSHWMPLPAAPEIQHSEGE